MSFSDVQNLGIWGRVKDEVEDRQGEIIAIANHADIVCFAFMCSKTTSTEKLSHKYASTLILFLDLF